MKKRVLVKYNYTHAEHDSYCSDDENTPYNIIDKDMEMVISEKRSYKNYFNNLTRIARKRSDHCHCCRWKPTYTFIEARSLQFPPGFLDEIIQVGLIPTEHPGQGGGMYRETARWWNKTIN